MAAEAVGAVCRRGPDRHFDRFLWIMACAVVEPQKRRQPVAWRLWAREAKHGVSSLVEHRAIRVVLDGTGRSW